MFRDLTVLENLIAAEWGDTARTDMTHSVTKTFLTTVVGLAWQRGLIRDLNDRTADYLPTAERERLFGSEHNAKITWEHLLRQTSDWSGTLWGVPDWADRPVGATAADWPNRPMHEPGTFFKYNDVRVNLLALVALHVWRRPLPEVLREEVMDPIGASNTWRWHGYENSWVTLDGRSVQSVSGGGHFGGGMFVNAWDMAAAKLFPKNGSRSRARPAQPMRTTVLRTGISTRRASRCRACRRRPCALSATGKTSSSSTGSTTSLSWCAGSRTTPRSTSFSVA